MVLADREVREKSDRKGDEAEKWQVRSNMGTRGSRNGMGVGGALFKTARGLKGGFLTRLAAETGQLQNDISSHTKAVITNQFWAPLFIFRNAIECQITVYLTGQ